MTTFFMNLTLPEPREALSPTWATQLNIALGNIDLHDHTASYGQRLTSAGIGINADLSLNSQSFTGISGLKGQNRTSLFTTDNSLSVKGGELYFRDDSSNNVQITTGGVLNFPSIRGIDGDYSSTLATVYYTDADLSYTLEDGNNNPATILVKDITNTTVDASGTMTAGALTANSTAALQSLTLAGTTTISGDMALNGDNSGRGIIPVGAVVGLQSNITGVPAIPTGYAALDGSTISDAFSPMNGVVLPNVNNSVFLMGSATAGSTGGANSYSLVEAQLPSHLHSINNSHADTFALGNASTPSAASHTHNMKHTHQFMEMDNPVSEIDYFGLTSSDNSVTSITSSNTTIIDSEDLADSSGGSAIMGRFISDNSLYTTGVTDANTGTGATAVTGAASSTTITLSGSVTANTGDSGTTGSGSAIDNRPSYISTQFIVRIK